MAGRLLLVTGAGALVLGLLAGPVPAHRQTFPGPNGPLVFGFSGPSIVVANPDGSSRRTVFPPTPGVSPFEPAWSADATKIAFSNTQGATGGIMIVNADGTGMKHVTNEVTDGEPTWSPDGMKLAFIHVSAGRRRLATINVDGTGLTVITPTLEAALDDPEWSPDGTRITFSNFADIYVVNADGSNLVNLTSGPTETARADHPSWSPDGTRIAYTYGLSTLKIVAATGGASTPIGSNLGELWELAWSPDGTKIAFIADVGGPLQEELFLINPDGSGLTRTGLDVAVTLDWGRAAAAPPPPPPPVAGVSVNLAPVSGDVRVRLRGTNTFVDLAAVSSIPVGSELDATRGRVRLVSAAAASRTQSADFYQGRATISQARTTPLTTLTLSEPLACTKRKASVAGAPKRVRRLWGSGKGSFVTKGRYAAATVRGTIWLTEDRCTSTLIRVRTGRVEVFDRVLRRRVIIRAGQSYVARAR